MEMIKMLKKWFTHNDEERQKEEYRRKSLRSYELTEQYATEDAVKNLMIDPTYLKRFWWNIPVSKADVVSMARLAGQYPLCFPAIRKLYTGEQPVVGEISWTSREDRLQKLEMLKQRLKMQDDRMAAQIKENPELINELNEINWTDLPNQLKSLNDVYKYASAYIFRFPAYAYAYTGVRFPCPKEGQTFEEAWAEIKENDSVSQEKQKETVKKRKGR